MTTPTRGLLLITGIPGTGKTCYGDKFASEFGFLHLDLEEQRSLTHFAANPAQFISDAKAQNPNVVVTWGFLPDQMQTSLVLQLRNAGFKLIWFDGNRPAALREFQKRGTVTEEAFYLQMYRIENTKIISRLRPVIINPFYPSGKFKSPAALLEEIGRE